MFNWLKLGLSLKNYGIAAIGFISKFRIIFYVGVLVFSFLGIQQFRIKSKSKTIVEQKEEIAMLKENNSKITKSNKVTNESLESCRLINQSITDTLADAKSKNDIAIEQIAFEKQQNEKLKKQNRRVIIKATDCDSSYIDSSFIKLMRENKNNIQDTN